MEIKLTTDMNRLLTPTEPWDFNNPPLDIIDLAQSMVDYVSKDVALGVPFALGVSYNQLQLPGSYSVFAMRGSPENFVCFNPRIVYTSNETVELEEGCLSFSSLLVPVTRPRDCRVRFYGPDGQVYTKQFTGMTARVFQHEMSHLQGKHFFDGVSRLKLNMSLKKAKKRGKDYFGLGLLKFAS